ncbi:MAG: biopolymer transporter ExbD, partial [Leeuwenhoekiella sp.]
GAGTGEDACSYCEGKKSESSSVNPDKAIISLVNNRGTSYKRYIAVQNELVAAYNQLRDREAQKAFGMGFVEMESRYNDPRTSESDKNKLEPRISRIRDMYPEKLSEAEPKK